jgi:hypothetical protein
MADHTFSEREGIKPTKKPFQFNSMDMNLRIGLWNTVFKFFIPKVRYLSDEGLLQNVWSDVYSDLFKQTIDDMPDNNLDLKRTIKDYILEDANYSDVYDLVEFLAKHPSSSHLKNDFIERCNEILNKESAGYYFVSENIIRITSSQEMESIEEAIEGPLETINNQMRAALEFLSDRENPNYRNSIKESISAVESLCQKLTDKPNATLGEALNLISKQSRIPLPESLKRGYEKIYGHASSSEGIRHGLSDLPTLTYEDAKYMLVSCSAFIKYLLSKADKAGIKLTTG